MQAIVSAFVGLTFLVVSVNGAGSHLRPNRRATTTSGQRQSSSRTGNVPSRRRRDSTARRSLARSSPPPHPVRRGNANERNDTEKDRLTTVLNLLLQRSDNPPYNIIVDSEINLIKTNFLQYSSGIEERRFIRKAFSHAYCFACIRAIMKHYHIDDKEDSPKSPTSLPQFNISTPLADSDATTATSTATAVASTRSKSPQAAKPKTKIGDSTAQLKDALNAFHELHKKVTSDEYWRAVKKNALFDYFEADVALPIPDDPADFAFSVHLTRLGRLKNAVNMSEFAIVKAERLIDRKEVFGMQLVFFERLVSFDYESRMELFNSIWGSDHSDYHKALMLACTSTYLDIALNIKEDGAEAALMKNKLQALKDRAQALIDSSNREVRKIVSKIVQISHKISYDVPSIVVTAPGAKFETEATEAPLFVYSTAKPQDETENAQWVLSFSDIYNRVHRSMRRRDRSSPDS